MRIALDTETGGLDAGENPILQLTLWRPEGSCLDLRIRGVNLDGTPIINPRTGKKLYIHPRAIQANGLNPADGMAPQEAATALVEWWKKEGSPRFHLIGQNVGPFDVPFAKQLNDYGVDIPWQMMFDYHYLDTATLAFAMQEAGILHFGKWSLANICQVLGVLYDPHLAKSDAKASWHAWHRMEGVLSILRAKAGDAAMQEIRTSVLHALDLRG